ncbi:helix-turn-helix transcriptional regulator [Alkaliphilus hydrothermalis]|uniref:Uncharacterized protein n=1 Tax=Alkaliphilus hydrothermalis TaxID=1482730 RepID=A0ABS2NL80_9FIRM|nr:helix-turn-helix domain-containing protein [Alkaliphilus hydrothermalis]MBM7613688.1 hypothetical protein [Alkaliphilus hydrothermalis]
MDSNIIIIIIGGFIIVSALIILLKAGNKEEDFNPEVLMGLRGGKVNNPQETLNHLAIMEGIEGLKMEVAQMKIEIERIGELLEIHNHQEIAVSTSPNLNNWENFDQSLNYNMFVQKNNDILKLHREGKSLEEIARRLNKSVREVEMVIKLIK